MSQPDAKDVSQRGDRDPSTRNDRRQYAQSNADPNRGVNETHRGTKKRQHGPQGAPRA